MKIDRNISSDIAAQTQIARVQRDTPSKGTAAVTAPVVAPKGDTVELSVQGRARAGDQPLSPDRIQTIRDRVTTGFYNTQASADAVAARIAASGDL
jgi:hypothetical protein